MSTYQLPSGLEPFRPPVSDQLHAKLSLLLFLAGFLLFSWLTVYLVTTRKESRSLAKELIVVGSTSVMWGLAALFGLLHAGLYV
jgi:hypothetical protein